MLFCNKRVLAMMCSRWIFWRETWRPELTLFKFFLPRTKLESGWLNSDTHAMAECDMMLSVAHSCLRPLEVLCSQDIWL